MEIRELKSFIIAAKYKIPICPHGGGLGLCNMIRHFAIWDQVAVSGHSNNQLVEYVDFLQDGVFIDPVKISQLQDGMGDQPELKSFNEITEDFKEIDGSAEWELIDVQLED